jgi:hypothetical protein
MSSPEGLVRERSAPAEAPVGSARLPARLMAAAVGLATVPVLIAAARGIGRHWVPTGDNAYSAVRAHDVFGGPVPLLGTWSSTSLFTGHQVNHPGPLQFDLLAVPVLALGHDAGTALGIALVNAASIAAIGWLMARRLGPAMAVLGMAACGLLAWSLGPVILYDPWSQHAPLVPFALFLVATWMVLAGDVVALTVLVVSGSYALQTHLSYIILIPAFTALAFGAVVWRLLAAWRARHRLDRRGLAWLAVGLGIGLVCWLQPLVEQATSPGEGNITALWRSAGARADTVGQGVALRMLGGTVAVPPAWLPPSFGSPSFRLDGHGLPTGLAAAGLAALVLALAVLGARARRRGSTAVVAGTAVALAAVVLGYVTTVLAPMHYGVAPHYVRWMWPLGMVVWLVLAVAVVEELMTARPRLSPARVAGAALMVAAVSAVAVAVPTTDNSGSSPRWTADAARVLRRELVPALDGRPVLVDLAYDVTTGAVGPSLFSAFQDAGIPFYVDQPALVRQLGDARRFSPGDADVGIVVRGGPIAMQHNLDEVPIASWSALSTKTEADRARLREQVISVLGRRGLRLAPGAETYLTDADASGVAREVARLADDPDAAVQGGLVCNLWSGVRTEAAGRPLLDARAFPPGLLDRWCTLEDHAANRRITVYRHPL